VLAVFRVGYSVETFEVVDEYNRRRFGGLAGRIAGNGSVELDNAVNASLGPTRRVEGQKVGEDDAHVGVVGAHLAKEDVVGAEDLVDGLLAQQHVVGTEKHEDDIGLSSVEPASEVAVLCKVGGKRAGVAFVVLVRASSTLSSLAADKVEVVHTVVAEIGLEVGTPASLENVSGVLSCCLWNGGAYADNRGAEWHDLDTPLGHDLSGKCEKANGKSCEFDHGD
jgi:hypothetical protein